MSQYGAWMESQKLNDRMRERMDSMPMPISEPRRPGIAAELDRLSKSIEEAHLLLAEVHKLLLPVLEPMPEKPSAPAPEPGTGAPVGMRIRQARSEVDLLLARMREIVASVAL